MQRPGFGLYWLFRWQGIRALLGFSGSGQPQGAAYTANGTSLSGCWGLNFRDFFPVGKNIFRDSM